MLAKFARLQGLEDEAKGFEKDAAKIKDCFNARFLSQPVGKIKTITSLYACYRYH